MESGYHGLTNNSTLITIVSWDTLGFSFLVYTVGLVKPTLQECFEESGIYVKYLDLAMGHQKWIGGEDLPMSTNYKPQKATCAL